MTLGNWSHQEMYVMSSNMKIPNLHLRPPLFASVDASEATMETNFYFEI